MSVVRVENSSLILKTGVNIVLYMYCYSWPLAFALLDVWGIRVLVLVVPTDSTQRDELYEHDII